MRPLEHITVVALEQAVAAPFATRQLADLGPRVLQIERPHGGHSARRDDSPVNGLSSYFVWLNRSKESLTLDLKHPAGRDVLARLLDRADVFVQNLAPGAIDRLGARPQDLRARHQRLIVCNVSGYGSSGPYADKKAYDLLVQSEVGLLSITGAPGGPAKVGISVADIAAGMYAYSGILTALFMRATSGQGSIVDASLFDALAEWMGFAAYYTAYSGSPPSPSGAHHASIAPYGPFPARDGIVYLAVQNEREWKRFCADVLDRAELADDDLFSSNTERVRNRRALHEAIEAAFAALSARDVIARLDRAGIANARMNSVREFIDHPQLAARNRWQAIASPAGPLRALVPPVQIEGVEPRLGDVPALGAHTDAILEEIGIDRATIASWHKEGIV